jgi:uncharacterized protein DUF3175
MHVTAKSKSGVRRTTTAKAAKPSRARRWSKQVMEHSDAMDLKPGIFKLKSPRSIALALKKSSEASRRRKSSPFRSAMSLLNFEINRGGKNLTQERVKALNQAKAELRRAFGRPA